jgi:hypothetical protein
VVALHHILSFAFSSFSLLATKFKYYSKPGIFSTSFESSFLAFGKLPTSCIVRSPLSLALLKRYDTVFRMRPCCTLLVTCELWLVSGALSTDLLFPSAYFNSPPHTPPLQFMQDANFDPLDTIPWTICSLCLLGSRPRLI